jgi:jumonji domain-containing protein 7
LIKTYHDYNPSSITQFARSPTALEFMRFVSCNQPFIIRRNLERTPFDDLTKIWTPEYLGERMRGERVQVAITPHGNADSIVQLPHGGSVFAKPYEVTEPFDQALREIHRQEKLKDSACATRYLQTQNDNLRGEYAKIFADVQDPIPWAREALEKDPDAVNFWLGNSYSVSATHKDNYENIYFQVCGRKHFVLLPPVEATCMNERSVLAATYEPRDNATPSSDLRKEDLRIRIDDPEMYIPSVTWDADEPLLNTTPYSQYARPLRVTLEAGDTLYLPALWYHKVSQSCGEEHISCSINYWYDLEYGGPFWSTAKFVQNVGLLSLQGQDQNEEEARKQRADI